MLEEEQSGRSIVMNSSEMSTLISSRSMVVFARRCWDISFVDGIFVGVHCAR